MLLVVKEQYCTVYSTCLTKNVGYSFGEWRAMYIHHTVSLAQNICPVFDHWFLDIKTPTQVTVSSITARRLSYFVLDDDYMVSVLDHVWEEESVLGQQPSPIVPLVQFIRHWCHCWCLVGCSLSFIDQITFGVSFFILLVLLYRKNVGQIARNTPLSPSVRVCFMLTMSVQWLCPAPLSLLRIMQSAWFWRLT